MKHNFTFLICLMAIITSNLMAQIKTPEASPAATITQNIGFSTATIEYNRPQLKGRDMFGNLTREGEVWRTGANMSTRLTISEGMTIEGMNLPAGQYSIYSIPGKKEWTIIINNKIQWGTVYTQEEDFLRFSVPTKKSAEKQESFTFYFANVTEESATLGFAWENTKVEMAFEAPVHEKVVAQIKEVMSNEDAATDGDFYAASDYYLNKGLDAQKALKWANVFVEKQGDKYWAHRLQARALAANGKYKEAIEAANKSTELATAAGNMDYVHNNGKSIAEWKKAQK